VSAFALAVLLAGGAAPAFAQCAMCRASIEGSAEGRRVSADLNRAILVLFAAPYLVSGTCATFLFRRRISSFLKEQLSRRR
jgi:hypothetical protein